MSPGCDELFKNREWECRNSPLPAFFTKALSVCRYPQYAYSQDVSGDYCDIVHTYTRQLVGWNGPMCRQ